MEVLIEAPVEHTEVCTLNIGKIVTENDNQLGLKVSKFELVQSHLLVAFDLKKKYIHIYIFNWHYI